MSEVKKGVGDAYVGGTKPTTFRPNLIARTVSSKLVRDPNKGLYTRHYSGGQNAPAIGTLGDISHSISSKILDAENILETLPDTELAMRIVVSSILSPTDLRSPELGFVCEESDLDPALISELITIAQEHFTKDYKIKDWLERALEDALFRTGSYPLAIIPENNLDDIINNRVSAGMEAFTASIKSNLDTHGIPINCGNLGAPVIGGVENVMASLETPSLEHLLSFTPSTPKTKAAYDSKIHQGLFVTDNPAALTLGLLADRAVGAKVRRNITGASKLKIAYENMNTMSELISGIYANPTNKMSEVVRIQGKDKATRAQIGHPLVMKLPSESVIPVHVPSNPEAHLGYFVLLDDLGHPINNAAESTHYQDLTQRIKNGGVVGNENSQILNSLSFLRSGFNCKSDAKVAQLSQSYAEAVEKDLLDRLKSGAYGDNVELSRVNEVYRIMLSRVLAGKRTMILYIPSDLVTYIAFHYTKLGVGRSLLDKNKMLASLRATLMFSNVMAALKNSVARQKVSITLDEADVDPHKTVDMILSDLAKLRSRATPFGTTAPLDIVDGIQQANISVEVTGNPRYPETSVGIEDIQSSRVQPDTELAERLDNQWWMGLGLAPEIVDSLQQIEFAAVQMTSNALMTKRMAMDQETYCGFLSDHVRKYIDNSGTLLSHMILAVRKWRNEREVLELETDDLMNGTAEETPAPEAATDLEASPGADLQDAALFNEQGMGVVAATELTDEDALEEDPYKEIADLSDLEVISEFVKGLCVTLPPPDTTRIQQQAEEFGEYSTFLDEAIPAYITPDVLSKIGAPEVSESVPEIIAVVKAYYQREYLIRNNILPELKELMVSADDQNSGMVENYVSFQDSIGGVLGKLLAEVKNRNNPDGVDGATGGADDYNTGEDNTGGGDDGFGGEDDALDADMPELGGDTDNPPEEGEEEQEEETDPNAEPKEEGEATDAGDTGTEADPTAETTEPDAP